MTSKGSVAFYTLGCKLNFSETATISRDFDSDRYDHVTFNTPAEVYVCLLYTSDAADE